MQTTATPAIFTILEARPLSGGVTLSAHYVAAISHQEAGEKWKQWEHSTFGDHGQDTEAWVTTTQHVAAQPHAACMPTAQRDMHLRRSEYERWKLAQQQDTPRFVQIKFSS